MKHRAISLVLAFTGGLLTHSAPAATVVLDTFSEGNFLLSNTGANIQGDSVISPAASFREVFGYDVNRWSASLPAGSGALTYTSRSPVPSLSFLQLRYGRFGGLTSLLDTNSFVLKVSALIGEADVFVYQSGNPGTALPVTLSAAGDLHIPIANMTQHFQVNPDNPLYFRFYPTTANFSITLDEIDLVVPEPATAGLAVAGVFLLLRKRRRP